MTGDPVVTTNTFLSAPSIFIVLLKRFRRSVTCSVSVIVIIELSVSFSLIASSFLISFLLVLFGVRTCKFSPSAFFAVMTH